MRVAWFVVAFSFLACGPARTTAESPPGVALAKAPAAEDWRAPAPIEGGRLSSNVVPTKYALELDIDPAQTRFQGRARIDLALASPTDTIVLHGRDLVVKRVSARASSGAVVARLAQSRASEAGGATDQLLFAFRPALPAGASTIEIEYDAPFGGALAGLYRARDGGRDYAFTQFEPSDARRAFPCFDDPRYKTPFEVSLRVPKGMLAIANAPEASRAADGDRTRFVFAPTEPIPSYLVALAVGEFDVVTDPKIPKLRVVTTKGRGEGGRPALAETAELLAWLERYLGTPYPYGKLDLVSVPDFSAGAMENPGLVTFREELLLSDPKRPSPSATRSREHVIAHELAHQWFGNLVTMEWWDDLWLNEAFATWLSARALEELRPTYGTRLGTVRRSLAVMEADALPSARPVRRLVRGTSEAMEAFDGMTYDKGAAVIRMLETTVRPEVFRAGINRYLKAHAHRTAKTEDLLAAISKESSETDPIAIAKSFLEQTGVPSISVERDCRKKDATVVLTQYPWNPIGAPPPARPLKQWAVPICLREQGNKTTSCTTLTERRAELPLARGCTGWLYANAEQGSYFRMSLAPGEVQKLVSRLADLSPAERLGLLANLWAQARAGDLAPEPLLTAVAAYDGQVERAIVEQVVDVLWGIASLVPEDADRRTVVDFVKARLGPRKQALGWKGGNDDAVLLRPSVLYAMGELAEDDRTLSEADALARDWLRDPKSLDLDTAAVAVELGSRRADATRFSALAEAATKLEDPRDRITALRALGGFDDPNLVVRALDFAIEGKVSLKDARYVFEGALRHRRSVPTVVAWVQSNWDRAAARFEGPRARRLVDPVYGLCERRAIDAARAFYKTRRIEGGARSVEEALAHADRCATLSDALRPGFLAAIEKHPSNRPRSK